jgi:acyl carrier protein
MPSLEQDLKQLIVEALMLEDVRPQDIESEAPLFVEGLGLDSIDALELAMAIERRYNVSFDPDDEQNRQIFSCVKSLADHVRSHAAVSGGAVS